MGGAPTFVDLAEAEVAIGRYEDAATAYRNALDADSTRTDVAGRLGTLLVEIGKFTEAVPFLESALRDHPTSARLAGRLSLAYAASGRATDAVRTRATALRLSPDELVYIDVGRGMMMIELHGDAIADFRAAATIAPNDPEPFTRIAMATAAAGDGDGAQRILQRILVAHPNYPPAIRILEELRRRQP